MAGNTVRSFICPACGGTVEIRAAGHSISAVCAHCSSVIDTANDNFRIIKKEHEASRNTDIPIGARGVLGGVKWEVIGYVEKKDKSYMSYWDEYLLFNPYFGFRFLIQSDGHWNLAAIIRRYLPLAGSPSETELDGEKFSVYCRGQSIVEYVKGEFYWRVRKGDVDTYTDYIAPPRMLSVEKNRQEVTESLAEYIEHEVIANAFKVELPAKKGVAPNQPPPFLDKLASLWKTAALSILVALIVQWSMGSGTLVDTFRFHIMPGDGDKNFSTQVFNLPKRSNLMVKTNVPISNSWMELEFSLVNEASNDVYLSRQVIEYYFGRDGGENWTEGEQSAESIFSAIPAGNYRLVIDPSFGPFGIEGIDVAMELRQNVAAWGNFWTVFLCIIALPIFALLYRWNFENKRWENSDYAPAIYKVGESDD